jgi:putative polyhydroxyalkanoic acid system protein
MARPDRTEGNAQAATASFADENECAAKCCLAASLADSTGARDHNCVAARLRYAVTVSLSDTVTVVVSHCLGRAEAVRRLKDGLAHTNGHLGAMIAIEQETWQGDTLRFRMRALGQTAAASVEVLEDALRIEVSLPWLLAKAAKRLLPILRKEATLLLEKK